MTDPSGPFGAKRSYSRLFAATVVALVSTGVGTVGLALLSYEIAGGEAGAVLGTALAIKTGTYVVLAPLAAAVVGHLPRRALLVRLDLIRAAIALAFPFATRAWEVDALIFLFQAASAAFIPTYLATVSDLLTDEKDYARALAKSRLAHELDNAASPMLAALMLALVPFQGLFAVAAMGFLVSAVIVSRTPLPPPATDVRRDLVGALTRGLRIHLGTPRLRGLIALNLCAALGIAMVIDNTVVLVHGRFGLGGRATTIALGVFGLGSALAALATPRLLDRVPDRLVMLAGAALVSAALLVGAAVSRPGLMLALWLVLGFGAALVITPAGRLLRRSSDTADRPAVYAAHFALSHVCFLIAYPTAGWLGVWAGLPFTFVALGVLALAALLAASRLWPHADPATGETDDRVPDEVGLVR
ncbi:MAG TPA: MFS transporter [Alphaproteobacteria bacterium]|nr:MFS transporter [Alphaproteobacteria bacterium]